MNSMLKTVFAAGLVASVIAYGSPVGSGFVKYDVVAHEKASSAGHIKRQAQSSLEDVAGGFSYLMQLGIGTPPQPVSVLVDTGSSELWVNPNCSTAQFPSVCKESGFYNASKSSTSKDLKAPTNLTYGIGSATAEWMTDNVVIGSGMIKSQRFAVAKDTELESFGILGVGYTTSPIPLNYSLFVDNLVAQNVIPSRAFGLNLQTDASKNGSIVFGGLDTRKYEGALEKLPIIPPSQSPDHSHRYFVNLESIKFQSANGSSTSISNTTFPVVLDSGTSFLLLPNETFSRILRYFPVTKFNQDLISYEISCSAANMSGTWDFTLGQKTIKVPISSLILPDNKGGCILAVTTFPKTSAAGDYILGAPFLRAAYAVFDQDNANIHIAQAADCGTNVVAISTGPDAVPSVTGACKPSSTGAIPTRTAVPTSGASKSGAHAYKVLAAILLIALF